MAGSTCSIAMERCHVAARKLAQLESWCTRLGPIEQLDRAQTEALLRETAAAAAEVGRAETWLAMERADTRAIWGGASTKGGEPSGHDAAAMATLQEMMHLGTAAGDEARPDAGTPTEAVVPATRRLPKRFPPKPPPPKRASLGPWGRCRQW